MPILNYKHRPVKRVGYFDCGANGSLSDLVRTNSLSVIRWITVIDFEGAPSLARDAIAAISQCSEMFGRESDVVFVYETDKGKVRELKNYNHLTE